MRLPMRTTSSWLRAMAPGLLALSCTQPRAELPAVAGDTARDHFPGASWERMADPSAAGWKMEELAAAREIWESNSGTSAVVVVHRGLVVDQWGDVGAKRTMRSIRKSLISSLLGLAVADGRIGLEQSLAELGMDDRTPLTSEEKRATVADLLASRSGVYIPAARENSGHRKRRPARGSHPPGSFFYYNNWDFNVLGVLYRDRVTPDVGAEFARAIATPIGMEDYETEDFEWRPEKISPHPAYDFEMSARDLARYGLLWLRGGRWGDRQIVPTDWVASSLTAVTPETWAGAGYGWLWWVQPPGKSEIVPEGYIYAEGGSTLWVVPSRELVVTHVNLTAPIVVRSKLGLLPDERKQWETFSAIVRAAPGG